MRIGIAGGKPVAVTQLDPPRQIAHRDPQFLPDGRHFLFHARGTPDSLGIYLGLLDGGQAKRLADADSAGMYLPPDYVIFVRQGMLTAQRLNLARGELVGDPVIIANPVAFNVGNLGGFSVSRDGRIAYRANDAGSAKQLIWSDHTGTTGGTAGEPVTDAMFFGELSPDESRIVINQSVQGNMDLWLLDTGGNGKTRLTFDPAVDMLPLWSPDGKRIAFATLRKGAYNLYLKASSGAGADELLLETPNNKAPLDWSRDGQFPALWRVEPENRAGPVGAADNRERPQAAGRGRHAV